MDPATIFPIVGTTVSLGDVVSRCITRLSALKAQFHDAPIIGTSMIRQLHMVKIAQDQLSPLNSPNFIHDPRYRQLAAPIGNALDSFGPILFALGQQLDRYEGVDAKSWSILRLAQDCSSSLVGLDDVASFISENTAAISTQFEFDDALRGTLLYQAVERSHLRQAIRARKSNEVDKTSTDSIFRRETTSGFGQAFRTMRLFKSIALSDSLKIQRVIGVDIRKETVVETLGDDTLIEGGPSQEHSSYSNPGSSDGPGLSAETERPAQSLLSADDSNSPPTQPSLDHWRKAFRWRTSNTHDTKPHQHPQKEENQDTSMIKVLLLGASGGGKTTIFNALRLSTDTEYVGRKDAYLRTSAWHNALDSVRDIKNIPCLAERAVHRLAPTAGDRSQPQVTTAGIHETKFTYNDCQFALYDCWGERSERKKWIHTLQDVSVVIYPVEATGYGRFILGAERMREQYKDLQSITASFWFIRSRFVVVFTKIDLLDDYLKDYVVRNYLTSMGIPTDVDEYLEYLEWRFRRLIRWADAGEERIRFVHTNLADVNEHNAAIRISNILDSFGSVGQVSRSGKEAHIFDQRHGESLETKLASPRANDGD
ncbi:hypothetical protein GGR55DRAFT_701795 [Xylaria sp. FL0064]|nr:hypothetical protein GGR55DRAFT_701795 [Xylaria sp. FL0064]